MNYRILYDPETNIVFVRIKGLLDADTMKDLAPDLAATIQKHGSCMILSDFRESSITSSTMDIYFMPRIIEEAGIPKTCKEAFVILTDSPDYQFLQITSANFGQHVKMFTDIEEAKGWLLETT